MPQPGWYPDPDGTPQRLRYWDGQRWTEHVQGTPPPAPPVRNPRPVLVVGVIAAALLLVVGLIAATWLRVPGLIAAPETSRPTSMPRSTPAPSPTIPAPFPTPAPPSATTPPRGTPAFGCPSVLAPDELTDGFLTVELAAGWSDAPARPWLRCGASAHLETSVAWASLSVGRAVAPADADSLEGAADAVLQLALLDAAQPGYLEVTSQPTIVDGLPAWRMDARVGDALFVEVVQVVVVHNGSETPSVVLASALEDDATALAAIAEVLATLSAG
ncbi:MAG: DUF2510 domain-containing protein [Actinomycetes bacterium]